MMYTQDKHASKYTLEKMVNNFKPKQKLRLRDKFVIYNYFTLMAQKKNKFEIKKITVRLL